MRIVRWQTLWIARGSLVVWLLLTGVAVAAEEPVFMAFTNTPSSGVSAEREPDPRTPREMFNQGTRRLRDGKLAESEALLQKAVESQDSRIQPPALYNLGHTRFVQGAEQLKKSASAGPSVARGRAAAQRADRAAALAREALSGNDVQEMLAAYMNGRGARRDLKEATAAIRRALELHGAALRKWQRAAGDFRSAAELNPSDRNAVRNAELVEREIARLIDSIREMQQMAQSMARSRQGLQDEMRQLGGRIPEPMMPPGAAGEEEEEEGEGEDGNEETPKPKPGQQEGPSTEGQELEFTLSPEEAGWILESLKGDGDRRLPMGQGEPADPKQRNRTRTW